MIYLDTFFFPYEDEEVSLFMDEKRTCYDSAYPLKVLSQKGLERLDFEPITILYGGNGSGKTTVLNIIAEKLKLKRETAFNHSAFFQQYVDFLCSCGLQREIPEKSCIITSDDVFDYMLNIRALNEGIDQKREELFSEYLSLKYADFAFHSLDDYEQLKKANLARSKTQSQYVRKNLMNNVRELSNGESAFMYFSEKITENALYLLDEPENSLSAENQIKLMHFLAESARYFNCQFVISTHSPFLLSIENAKIYDLDEEIVDVKPWTELKNIRAYYDFFMEHEADFEKSGR
ncbi:AAA family ATPase [Anaerovorax odorimutans]|uniref:AAA family ATPase n=1 Tax=Anaerovorax odorimutans TaxID=109327 RepID=A0ABT1RQ19_9FIRM|nr:AAA family ATPase [Anaerovorax odorimutans]MCQ4637295.1 AAA family ATPase [Anaerovorax odorimutans]